MPDQIHRPLSAKKSAARTAALHARFARCQAALQQLPWVSEGSLTASPAGHWRWTRKVKAKTVTVALSAVQADAFREAIAQHRRLEKLIREMRALSQTYLLEILPGPPRRRPRSTIQKPR
jgi:hypothetical protein